jgi:peptidoglycan hydrolase-like protein with peptidoglycan-binding domain
VKGDAQLWEQKDQDAYERYVHDANHGKKPGDPSLLSNDPRENPLVKDHHDAVTVTSHIEQPAAAQKKEGVKPPEASAHNQEHSKADGSNPEVAQTQAYLKFIGRDPGPIDGVAGKGTKEALDAFAQDYQKSHPDDKTFNPHDSNQVKEKLEASIKNPTVAGILLEEMHDKISQGKASPDDIKAFQQVLKANGGDLGKHGVDGVDGTATEKAYQAVQARLETSNKPATPSAGFSTNVPEWKSNDIPNPSSRQSISASLRESGGVAGGSSGFSSAGFQQQIIGRDSGAPDTIRTALSACSDSKGIICGIKDLSQTYNTVATGFMTGGDNSPKLVTGPTVQAPQKPGM